jgi:YbbR domain-containing protein
MAWHPLRNLGLKIVALGLGVLLWITVSGQQAERGVRVPVEFRKKPATLEITSDPPETVEVWIHGSSSQIGRLGLGDVVAFIDLTDARPGLGRFPLRTDQAFGVEVTRVDPSELALQLEQSGTATVPVTPTIDGQPAPGYARGGVDVDPKTVEVVGPVSRLRNLKAATTDRISVEGARAAVTDTVNISVSDAGLRLREPRTARVTINIVSIPRIR